MKISFFEANTIEEEQFKNTLSKDHELLFFHDPVSQQVHNQIVDSDILVIFINSKITKETLENFSQVKCIVTMSTGVDHIDLAECKKRGILVSNVPRYGEVTVAEHTFALILAVSRKLIDSIERVKNGTFSPEGLTGFDLFGKTLGVIGVGAIGSHVMKIANGFGMYCIAYQRKPDPALEKHLGFVYVSFDELLSQSDIITLHVPLTDQTHHMISTSEFQKMKKEVVVINTSRGGIIDTRALLDAVENKTVGGVGLDVCEDEPLLSEEKELLSREYTKEQLLCVLETQLLLKHPNVIVTPHNAFNSREALLRIANTTITNIKQFIAKNPVNTVSQ